MESVWDNVERVQHQPLTHDVSTDVLVIGGGAAGLLCTYFLQQNGIRCVLVEKGRICGGVTGRTTAKITAQHGFLYQTLLSRDGLEAAQMYLHANDEAVRMYAHLCAAIDCDYQIKDNYVYTLNDRRRAEAEQKALERIGAESEFCERLGLPFATAGAVRFPRQAQFHPLKFFTALSASLPIYENTRVREIKGDTAVTDGGKISAKAIIVATHFPFLNRHGLYFLKMYQYRSYILALTGATLPDGMYVDEEEGGLSLRMLGDTLLLGGKGGQTGKGCGGFAALRDAAHAYYPNAQEKIAWATQDCITLDSLPYIGRYSNRTHQLYTATGFGKWGMTGSMVAAMILRDAILGRSNAYAALFDPSRSMLHAQLTRNAWTAATNLLSFSRKRCPHLGCALHWNGAEHSWDCPCHGSRFSAEGRLLDNPANGDLKKRRTNKK